MLINLLIFVTQVISSSNIYCTGHDACRNKVWNGEYNIYCGGTNSERTCHSTTLNCGVNQDCKIETRGSGHDAYQNSVVNAKESNSFMLTCGATGFRDCKTITIWCPQKIGTNCQCVGCPNSVTMKCVDGVSCSSTSSATIDYVTSEYTENISPSPSQTFNGYFPEISNDNCCQHNSNVNNQLTLMCKTCAYNLFNKGVHGNTYKYYNNNNLIYKITCDDNSFNSVICNGYNYQNNENYVYQSTCQDYCIDRYNNIPGKNRAWRKDSMHTGMRPDCPFVKISNNNNYLWQTLDICKRKCITEPSGRCNMLSRFGDKTKKSTENYHCRFYACSDPFNFSWVQQTQWGNFANEANTYIIPIRKYQVNTCTNIVNETNFINSYINITRYINQTREIINYIDRYMNHTKYINITRYINQTRNILRYINTTRYINKTQYINQTRNILRYINVTRYINQTRNILRYINTTRYINKTQYINQTRNILRYINVTRYINQTRNILRYINVTSYINQTRNILRYINVTRYINKTNYINQTRTILRYINVTRYINKTNYINQTRTILRYINATRYKNVTNYIGVGINNNNEQDIYDTIAVPSKNNTLKCDDNKSLLDRIFMYGFFTCLGINILFIICCWLKCNNVIKK